MTSTNGPIAESENPARFPSGRRFSPEYKLRTVAEHVAAPSGEEGAILRRERLYHSYVIEWRAARDAGAMSALVDKRTSATRLKKAAEQAELERFRKKVARLEKEGEQKDAAPELL